MSSGYFHFDFYPRPPRGGRPRDPLDQGRHIGISTHALHEEGDQEIDAASFPAMRFLPTPSTRRATVDSFDPLRHRLNFYPRPPRGGRPQKTGWVQDTQDISTHALHEEGDIVRVVKHWRHLLFLPTPSTRRATIRGAGVVAMVSISTHALHEEGDIKPWRCFMKSIKISTHALHEEGDVIECVDFRRGHCSFLPTPSTRRATHVRRDRSDRDFSSYPRPPR